MEKNKNIIIGIIIIIAIYIIATPKETFNIKNPKSLSILSSPDNSYLEKNIKEYAKSEDINIKFTYMGDIDIVDEINSNSNKYDAVWISNSMWLYMLNNQYAITDSKSISISPVVVGIKESKAKSLELEGKEITNKEILNLINDKKIKYVMSSVTRTNTGATAYFGFLNALAGNPEVLTEDMLKEDKLKSELVNMFSGVERVSGDEEYLKEMFLKGSDYEAVLADEASLININTELKKQNKEQLYLLYPTDGVAINDSTFAFINNNEEKENNFLKIQKYLLSGKGQKMLENAGRRTWYGGIKENANKEVFNKKWGIDTTNYLNVTKYPSKKVMNAALDLYIEELRKPTHVVFCLDYSGSMYGSGISELRNAMKYILNHEEAKSDRLQFSKKDKITIITFSDRVSNVWKTDNGHETEELINNVVNFNTGGATALYDAINKGLNTLNKETDEYTKTIIAMTDGEVNVGNYNELDRTYNKLKSDTPIYSIMFGDANERQLNSIANLSNAKVFDGRDNLLRAFKEVRGYN